MTWNNIHLRFWIRRSEAGNACICWATDAKNNVFRAKAWVFSPPPKKPEEERHFRQPTVLWFGGDVACDFTMLRKPLATSSVGRVSWPGLCTAASRSPFWLIKQRMLIERDCTDPEILGRAKDQVTGKPSRDDSQCKLTNWSGGDIAKDTWRVTANSE